MHNLILALEHDPDLASINRAILPKVIQCLYICTGCDYISFFSNIGKVTFAKIFFQHSSFICGTEASGTLADPGDMGFLAFMRLIGTTYFKKNASGFDTPSPSTHFLQFCDSNLTPKQQHSAWLEDIRQTIWYRVKCENHQIASDAALWLHWQRCCWVSDMWGQADTNYMTVASVVDSGWTLRENKLCVVWDSTDNVRAIQERVQALLTGCKCVTGCKNGRCGCVRKKRHCAEGCECQNCQNMGYSLTIASSTTAPSIDDVTTIELEEIQHELDDDLADIMDVVFGEDGAVPHPQDYDSSSSDDCSETEENST